jgi:hypothetical protein
MVTQAPAPFNMMPCCMCCYFCSLQLLCVICRCLLFEPACVGPTDSVVHVCALAHCLFGTSPMRVRFGMASRCNARLTALLLLTNTVDDRGCSQPAITASPVAAPCRSLAGAWVACTAACRAVSLLLLFCTVAGCAHASARQAVLVGCQLAVWSMNLL